MFFLLRFDKQVSNYLQIPSKYLLVGADEDGRMLFFHNELLVYIFKCKWYRETAKFQHKNFYSTTFFNLIKRITVAT